jgi:hypothetical protein
MKSLVLSTILTTLVALTFMSLIDSNSQSWVTKLPSWTAIPMVVTLIIAYLIALYWGFFGMWHTQKLANFFGFLLSLAGLGIMGFGVYMQMAKSTATEGQFEYSQTAENSSEIKILQPIFEQTKLKQSDVKMLTYWELL